MRPTYEKQVYSTPWFQLIEKRFKRAPEPHYAIRIPDYVSVIAKNKRKDFILVRQFRPAIGRYTLEFPAGHVENG